MGSSVELFKNLRGNRKIFIETGTWTGDGIQRALQAGYEKIYSCDIIPEMVEKAREKFSDKDVTVFQGASFNVLPEILKGVKEPATIFLDGHSMPVDFKKPELGFGKETVEVENFPCPLLEELRLIEKHGIKNHVIIIDDVECFGTWAFGYIDFEDVLEIILKINPSYKHSFYGNTVFFTAF